MRIILAYGYRICLRALSLCIIFLALLLVLLNLAVRSVLLYEDEIESWASDNFGVPFSFEIESTRWLGMRPELFANQVYLGEGDSAVKIAQVVAEPDLLRSALTLSPSWQDLRLEGVELALHEQSGGGWKIAGIDLVSQGNSEQATVIEKMLLGSRRIEISDIQTRLQFLSGTEINMQLDSALIENSLGFHRLVVNGELNDDANQLDVVVELTGISNRFYELDGLAYASFQGGDLSEVLTTLIDRYSETPTEFQNPPSASGEIWANIHSGSRAEFQGNVEIANMPGHIVSEEFENLFFHSDISGHFFYFEDDLSIDFVEPDFSAASKEWPLRDFRITRRQGSVGSAYSLQMHSIDLESLTQRVSDLYALPERLTSVIKDLDPSGLLENVEVYIDSGAPADTFSISADLIGIDLGYYRRAPAVRNLSGHLSATATTGRVEVDATDLSVHYPPVYDWWLNHGSVTGTVGWSIRPDTNQLIIFGESLTADAPEAKVQGDFLVEASTVPREEGMDFYLHAGFQNADAEHWPKFVPTPAPDSLKNWLASADLVGDVPQGAIIYRGKVKKGYEDFRSIQLRLEAESAQVSYLDSWPEITQANADIIISNRSVNISSRSASLPGIALGDIDVYLDVSKGGGRIELSANGSGDTDSMLDLVRHTGLRSKVGDSLDLMRFEGESDLQLKLVAPLKKELVAEEVDVNLTVDIGQNKLLLEDQKLNFDALDGTLVYDAEGIGAEQLSATLWGEPLTLSIHEEKEFGLVNLAVKGEVSVDSVGNWLNLDLLRNFSGSAQLDGLVQINTDRESELPNRYLFMTDMLGIESQLPGELSKPADEESQLAITIESSDEQHMTLDWSKGLFLSMKKPMDGSMSAGIYDSAVLSIDATLPTHQPGKFLGSVSQAEIEVEAWLKALLPADNNPLAEQGKLLGLAPDFALTSQHLLYQGKDYGQLELGFASIESGWRVNFQNSFAEGAYLYPYEETITPSLRFISFDLDNYKQLSVADTPEQDSTFDPRTLPTLDVFVESLTLSETNKGSWSATLKPSEYGLSVENLECQYKTLTCGAGGASSLFWAYNENEQDSALSMTLDFEDVSDMFSLAGIDSPLTSSSGEFYVSINWDAEPQKMLDMPLSGILGVNLISGEFQSQSNSMGAGIMRLVGLVNIDTWLRRLQLDFSDVAAGGTAYDELGGDFTINQGVVNTLTPVYVDLPSGKMLFDGAVDLEENEVDAQLVVTLPARQNMTWIAALAGGLPAAVGVWVVGKIFDDELDSLASVSYRVTGPLEELDVKTERVFDATVQQQ